jgi:hypothetical protein
VIGFSPWRRAAAHVAYLERNKPRNRALADVVDARDTTLVSPAALFHLGRARTKSRPDGFHQKWRARYPLKNSRRFGEVKAPHSLLWENRLVLLTYARRRTLFCGSRKVSRAKRVKPQKGNQYTLVCKQHVFPARSIERFARADRKVSVRFLNQNNKLLYLKPTHELFCAARVWDQRAEIGYMKEIEDSFQCLASHIVDSRLTSIAPNEQDTVSRFFALWSLRARGKTQPMQNQPIYGVLPGKNLTMDQKELLESQGLAFINDDTTIPDRILHGLKIQRDIDKVTHKLRDKLWGVVKAADGDFLIPDIPSMVMVPVSQISV